MHEQPELRDGLTIHDPVWIPLADGTRLAARIILPANAERMPVPAVLEYLPYRRSDGTYRRDAVRHPYLAAHGIARGERSYYYYFQIIYPTSAFRI